MTFTYCIKRLRFDQNSKIGRKHNNYCPGNITFPYPFAIPLRWGFPSKDSNIEYRTHKWQLMQIVSAFLRQAQYTGTKPTQPGLGYILCHLRVEQNHSCFLPLCLSPVFEEVEAIHCMPSANWSGKAPQYNWFFLFHWSLESKKYKSYLIDQITNILSSSLPNMFLTDNRNFSQ